MRRVAGYFIMFHFKGVTGAGHLNTVDVENNCSKSGQIRDCLSPLVWCKGRANCKTIANIGDGVVIAAP